jgi:hypothetical protein
MLSSGFGGVPSTFSTRSANTGADDAELTAVKNVLGFAQATPQQRSGTSAAAVLDLLAALETDIAEALASGGGTITDASIAREYPPAALPANTSELSGQAYGNGEYVASASSMWVDGDAHEWRAFDKSADATDQWMSALFRYVQADPGNYTGDVLMTVSGFAYAGEWLQLQLPSAIYADEVHITTVRPEEAGLGRVVLAGSNDGVTWSLLSAHIDPPAPAPGFTVRILASPGLTAKYTHVRIIALQMYDLVGFAVSEMKIFQYDRPIPSLQNALGYSAIPPTWKDGMSDDNLYASVVALEGNLSTLATEVADVIASGGTTEVASLRRREYPPGPMMTDTTALSGFDYGDGEYIATASSNFAAPSVYLDINPYTITASSTWPGNGFEPQLLFDGSFGTSVAFDHPEDKLPFMELDCLEPITIDGFRSGAMSIYLDRMPWSLRVFIGTSSSGPWILAGEQIIVPPVTQSFMYELVFTSPVMSRYFRCEFDDTPDATWNQFAIFEFSAPGDRRPSG